MAELSPGTFVITLASRNPSVDVPGFPDKKPEFPKYLCEKFADKRWIDISDPKLLDYENAQLLLVGAHENLEETEVKITGKPDLFKTLGLTPKVWPTETIDKGKFTEPELEVEASASKGDRTKGGRHGGKKAMQSSSAAGIAKALKGIDLPQDRSDIVKYAKDHGAQDEVVNVLEELPRRKYETMADIEKAVGEVR
ncbi:MAG: DUF2795 domain-containing protein [Oligoflexus sp.]